MAKKIKDYSTITTYNAAADIAIDIIMRDIKNEFIQKFTNSGNIDPIREYGLELLTNELQKLGMSEEEINNYLDIIIDQLDKLVDELVIEAADKIHSCHRTNCTEKGIAGTCSKCQKVYYCSKECQVKHWQIHKKKCKKA